MFHVKQRSLLHPAFLKGLVLLLILIECSACTVSRNPISGRKRAYGYTWEQERQLGAQSDQQIVQQMGVYEDPDLQAYVERIGQQVLEESHLRAPDADPEYQNTPFTFRIIDSPVVNAFALPGGYIYVTRGLLTHLNNEAQLAVVLGHEIVHVAARHASQRAFEAQTGQLGVIAGAILGQAVLGGQAAQSILDLGGTATQLLLLSYGRDDERESDRHGVAYAAQAGYEAGEAAEFFISLKRLGEQAGGGLPNFLSTHPDPGEREETIRDLAADWSQQAQMTLVREDEYLRQIDGVIVGADPRQGFVQDGVFYHPELRFRFPAPRGFLLDNGRSQVTMVEQQSQQAAIIFSIASGATSAREAAAQFLGQQGITVEEQQNTSVNGLPAHYALSRAQLEGGQEVGLMTYFIQHGGNVYYFVGLAPVANFNTYSSAFRQTMQGFAPENRSEIVNVQPRRLRIVNASRTAPFSAFVPRDLPAQLTPEGLAILNQVGLDEQVSAGTALKLP
jgi:predicted Zn-dependent protease